MISFDDARRDCQSEKEDRNSKNLISALSTAEVSDDEGRNRWQHDIDEEQRPVRETGNDFSMLESAAALDEPIHSRRERNECKWSESHKKKFFKV